MKQEKVIAALRAAWQREMEAARLYQVLADQEEANQGRSRIFQQLAEIERGHAGQFAARILQLGGIPPREEEKPAGAYRFLAATLGTDAMLRRLEAAEERNMAEFGKYASDLVEDAESNELFLKIEEEERQHATLLQGLKTQEEPRTRLEAMLKGEKWHGNTGSWIGDAIYGLNDGLGAVFGVVSGMAGAAANTPDGARVVLTAGLVATVASAFSMGSSAFMAGKSEREVYEAEIERERLEIEQSPEHEREELQLIYQLKGLSEGEAQLITNRIATDPQQFLKTMAQEELGLSERHFPNPWKASLSAAVSTAAGGFIPVLPFFFIRGLPAVAAAALIGMAAHFAVGAAKSLITARSWWKSGLEMTLIGFLCGIVTYGVGVLLHIG